MSERKEGRYSTGTIIVASRGAAALHASNLLHEVRKHVDVFVVIVCVLRLAEVPRKDVVGLLVAAEVVQEDAGVAHVEEAALEQHQPLRGQQGAVQVAVGAPAGLEDAWRCGGGGWEGQGPKETIT